MLSTVLYLQWSIFLCLKHKHGMVAKIKPAIIYPLHCKKIASKRKKTLRIWYISIKGKGHHITVKNVLDDKNDMDIYYKRQLWINMKMKITVEYKM